jgi:hypothetical protein
VQFEPQFLLRRSKIERPSNDFVTGKMFKQSAALIKKCLIQNMQSVLRATSWSMCKIEPFSGNFLPKHITAKVAICHQNIIMDLCPIRSL